MVESIIRLSVSMLFGLTPRQLVRSHEDFEIVGFDVSSTGLVVQGLMDTRNCNGTLLNGPT